MQATINFQRFETILEEIDSIMKVIHGRYDVAIDQERALVPDPIITEPMFFRRWRQPKVTKLLSFNDYFGDEADEIIELAKTVEDKWRRLYSGPFDAGQQSFVHLGDLCYSAWCAKSHHNIMRTRLMEAITLKAVSVMLSDNELANCHYYRNRVAKD